MGFGVGGGEVNEIVDGGKVRGNGGWRKWGWRRFRLGGGRKW